MVFTAQRTANASSLNFGRVAKPLRGGGGGGGSGIGGGAGMTSPSGYSSANPLARLQGEDGGGSGTYEVYFGVYCAPQAGGLIANANRMLCSCCETCIMVLLAVASVKRRVVDSTLSEWLGRGVGGTMAERTGEEEKLRGRGSVMFYARLTT